MKTSRVFPAATAARPSPGSETQVAPAPEPGGNSPRPTSPPSAASITTIRAGAPPTTTILPSWRQTRARARGRSNRQAAAPAAAVRMERARDPAAGSATTIPSGPGMRCAPSTAWNDPAALRETVSMNHTRVRPLARETTEKRDASGQAQSPSSSAPPVILNDAAGPPSRGTMARDVSAPTRPRTATAFSPYQARTGNRPAFGGGAVWRTRRLETSTT